ncbi:CidA/LrgA family protein [Paenibacillus pini]|uniref:Antiholin-like protein LrgA n=2 Tax=Paenibacillus TaxID=44249 RepID=W7YE83_9BACL|nr:hypothetical protein JCM16418_3351 [Paenibacillus pini JCM 16418]
MNGFAILLGFQLAGWLIQKWTGILLPGNVIGLLLFIAALFLKWVPVQKVEDTSSFLLKNMSLFFIPVIVGSITFFPYIKEHWAVLASGGVLSFIFTLIITGGLVQRLLHTRALNRKEDETHVHHG